MFWVVIATITIIWLIFYRYYRNLKIRFKCEDNVIRGTIIHTEFSNSIIRKNILTVKINKDGEEKIVKTNYYGGSLFSPSSGLDIKLLENKNNKYENDYNFWKLKVFYTSTIVGIPVAIVIAIVLKVLLRV